MKFSKVYISDQSQKHNNFWCAILRMWQWRHSAILLRAWHLAHLPSIHLVKVAR